MSASPTADRLNVSRVLALAHKESLQIVRDPSAILIAFVLPAILLLLFTYAVSLDVRRVPIGVVLESDSTAARELAAAFGGTRYFSVMPARDRREVQELVVAGKLRGFVVIPQDFDRQLLALTSESPVQVIADGSQPNTANFVSGYAQGVVQTWLGSRNAAISSPVAIEPRFWFNAELESRRFLVPGAIAIVMTMIGTLLTALVIAREWERGTMEAIMSTPATVFEILVAKLLPYFGLGLAATLGCALLSIFVFGVPLVGSWLALFVITCTFLVPALGQGMMISVLTRNQFIAAQAALLSGFLPAFLLSGFLFEIDSMPLPIRLLTYVVPARYFVAALQTLFLAGDVWPQFLRSMLSMLVIGTVFFSIAALKTRKSLE